MSSTLRENKDRSTTRTAKSRITKEKLYPYLWILPSVLLSTTIIAVPVVDLFITAFSEVSGAGIRQGFAGLDNFTALFQTNTFLMVLKNTLVWTVGIVSVTIILSLAIAILLNQQFFARGIVRAALIFPWAASLLITSVIWRYILDFRYGTLNLVLKRLGLIDQNINWLTEPSIALAAMIGVGILVSVPFASFILMAGLQSIPAELYDAAKVDGAGSWARFIYITLPQLRSALTIAIVLNTIYVFNSFPIIWIITRGEPLNQTDIVFTYLYKLGFEQRQLGEAAAVSVISFIVLLAFAILYVSLATGREE
jgi:multiple sugar transport system permease protein